MNTDYILDIDGLMSQINLMADSPDNIMHCFCTRNIAMHCFSLIILKVNVIHFHIKSVLF